MTEKTNNGYIYGCALGIACGGLILGYDMGIISGALVFLESQFALSLTAKGFAVSSAIIGSMLGVSFAGYLGDRLGRKKILLLSALFFLVAVLGCSISNSIILFFVFRFLCGIGAGSAAMLPSMYISELSPPKIRGRLISINQFTIVFGILAAYFINSKIVSVGNEAWLIDVGWRWMFVAGTVPPAILLISLLFIPESPRWLIANKKENVAMIILEKIGGQNYARMEVNQIEKSLSNQVEKVSIKQLLEPGLRAALIVGIGLGVFAHATGINLIVYYTPEILRSSGIEAAQAIGDTVLVGLANFIFTFVAFMLVDKLGRKPLLLVGSVGMGIALFLLGGTFMFDKQGGPLTLLWIVLYVALFAVAMGPVVWVVIGEIFPTNVRGRAVSLAALSSWIACFTISQLFPIMLESLKGLVFFVYGAICIIAAIFVTFLLPETKGKSLEEIENLWKCKS